MLLGSGELGKEVAIAAQRLGCRVIAVDRYAGAPAMQRNPWSGGADISPLDDAGVPTLGLLQDSRTYFDYHHTDADTFDKIVPEDFRKCVAAMAVMSYGLAELK